MTYLFAALCAVANAIFSVLQRKANRDQPGGDNLSPRLVVDLLRNPAWFLGSCGVIGGLLLQAAALSGGALALVEPIRIFELSATLLLAGIVFHGPLSREWLSAAAMAVGLGGLLYFLSPSASHGGHLPALRWATGIVINLAVIAALVGWAPARRQRRAPGGPARDRRRNLVRAGLEAALQQEHRQPPCGDHPVGLPGGEDGTEAVCGERGSHGLDQRRWPAGRRATRDHRSRPVVSILWGTPASGETVRGGFRLVLAVISARGHRRRNRRAVPLTAGQRRRRRTGTARGGKREPAMTGPGPRRNGLA